MNDYAKRYLKEIELATKNIITLAEQENISEKEFKKIIRWKKDCQNNVLFKKGIKDLLGLTLSECLYMMIDTYVLYEEVIDYMQEDCDMHIATAFMQSDFYYELYILVYQTPFGIEVYEIDETNKTIKECTSKHILDKVYDKYNN